VEALPYRDEQGEHRKARKLRKEYDLPSPE
jgi:hypothetical protein